MVRIILILLLVAFVLAVKFLPWWGWLIGIVVIGLAGKFLAGRVLRRLFSIPFRAKGKVLRGAVAQVHKLKRVKAPPPVERDQDDDEDDDTPRDTSPRDHYEIEVTITPQNVTGPFHHWEPDELRLMDPKSDPFGDDDGLCEVCSVHVVSPRTLTVQSSPAGGAKCPPEVAPASGRPVTGQAVSAVHSDDESDDEAEEGDGDDEGAGSKFLGPQRLKLVVGVRPHVRKLTFCYYFEKFGSVEFAGTP